jgi:hypothetical protein
VTRVVARRQVGLSALAFCKTYGFRTVCVDLDPERRAQGSPASSLCTAARPLDTSGGSVPLFVSPFF